MSYRESFLNVVLDIVGQYFEGQPVNVYHYDSHVAHAVIGGTDYFFLKRADGSITYGAM